MNAIGMGRAYIKRKFSFSFQFVMQLTLVVKIGTFYDKIVCEQYMARLKYVIVLC